MRLKSILAFVFGLAFVQVQAQQTSSPDTLKTSGGPLVVQPISHGTLALKFKAKTIYVDPTGGAEAFKGVAKPDLILITDIHGDHLDTTTLGTLDTKGVKLVVPQAVADQLPNKYKQQLVILKNNGQSMQQGINITALPMYNLPDTAGVFHPKGRGNGYLLEIGDKRVYISGDTEGIPEMRSLKNIDLAFVSMNLPYTMDVDQAADAVLEFQPKIVYPYHYRGTEGMSDVESFKNQVNAKNKDIEVRLKEWYPKK
ncbi:MBL fold metallo-hydrolase [Pontibacter anaerobius]|uniref:MBL fold metallo-hydrolase n=1 Tax=Pontibacter anaerobius TaxID=2993940 RepID=A0ABT3RCY8_9BACT|nr:MBL fold metallo-hydrolase [Pontibacter anaerobius]MCX2739288.1 MBL fold metallo-hydrolase [Pontibacter anaerobius]